VWRSSVRQLPRQLQLASLLMLIASSFLDGELCGSTIELNVNPNNILISQVMRSAMVLRNYAGNQCLDANRFNTITTRNLVVWL
jgi:hypothetical protein